LGVYVKKFFGEGKQKIKKYDKLDIKYIAGFFDADGHCSISFVRPNSVKIEIGWCNNYQDILIKIREFFNNYGKMFVIVNDDERRKRPSYRYKIWRMNEVKEILQKMLPYLHIKRRQAELILEFIKSRTNHKKIRTPYTDYELKIIEELKKEHIKLRGERIYGRKIKK